MNRPIVILMLLAVLAWSRLARAAGPQFTGLMPDYAPPPNPNFITTADLLARMDLDGVIPGTEVPLPNPPTAAEVWSDLAVSFNRTQVYATTHRDVYKIQQDGTATQVPIAGQGIVPPTWVMTATWDVFRQRLVVATLGVPGQFLSYDGVKWKLMNNLQDGDLLSIVHRPFNDSIYAFQYQTRPAITQMLRYNADGLLSGVLQLSPAIAFEPGSADLDWQMLMASDGQIAVIAPTRFPAGSNNPGSMLYLINPDTGEVTYGARLPDAPDVPEPGAGMTLLAAVGLVARRSSREGRPQ